MKVDEVMIRNESQLVENAHHPLSKARKNSLRQKVSISLPEKKEALRKILSLDPSMLRNEKPSYSPVNSDKNVKKPPLFRRLSSKFWEPEPVPKPDTHRWLRWNILWFLILCLGIVPLPYWLLPLHCYSGFVMLTVANVWSALFLVLCMFRSSYTMWRMFRAEKFGSFLRFYPKTKEARNMVHVVVMCAYKEPLTLLQRTLESLQKQSVANRIFMVVAFEKASPDLEWKKMELEKEFGRAFLHLMFTEHPRGVAGEIPGKCSNVNYASRQAVVKLKQMGLHRPENSTLTSCDTDNLFPSRYFEFLGYDFYRKSDRLQCVWQAPLLYNYNLDKRPFFVRVTGMLRAVLTTGVLIPQNINTMSVTSMSLEICERGLYFHPAYQMDDIIFVLSRMVALQRGIKIYPILFPVISGPTSGDSFKQEVVEWARQARRWTIGAAEVFHYLCVKFDRVPLLTGLVYALKFTHYYGFFLCAMSLLSLNGLIASSVFEAIGVCHPSVPWLPLLSTVFLQVFFAWMLLMNRIGLRLAAVEEPFSFISTVVDWVLAPFVLLGYSLIEFYALTEVALFGKKVCTHGASKKNILA